MAYLPKSNVRYTSQATRFAKSCQDDFLQKANMKEDDSPFGARLRKAFKGASNKEIGDKMGYSPADMTKYMLRGEFPTSKKMVEISRITKFSIHWLLTGAGSETVVKKEEGQDTRIILDDRVDLFIERIRHEEGKDRDRVVHELIVQALKQRSSELFSEFEKIPTEQLDELLTTIFNAGEGHEEDDDGKRGNNVS